MPPRLGSLGGEGVAGRLISRERRSGPVTRDGGGADVEVQTSSPEGACD